jgi:hypothetical protein
MFLIIRETLTNGRWNCAGMGIAAFEKFIVSSLPIVSNRRPVYFAEVSIRNQIIGMEDKEWITWTFYKKIRDFTFGTPSRFFGLIYSG